MYFLKSEGFTKQTRKYFGQAIALRRNIYIPVNEIDRLHWTFVQIQPLEQKITYHDSFHTQGTEICRKILDFIEAEKKMFKSAFNRSEWKISFSRLLPKQVDNKK